jgi:hypothetical protein
MQGKVPFEALAVHAVMNQEAERVPDPRLAEITGALRSRLRPVCSHMREDDFENLIEEIAQRERRWERRSNLRVERNADTRPN